jgi:hypothetical protein
MPEIHAITRRCSRFAHVCKQAFVYDLTFLASYVMLLALAMTCTRQRHVRLHDRLSTNISVFWDITTNGVSFEMAHVANQVSFGMVLCSCSNKQREDTAGKRLLLEIFLQLIMMGGGPVCLSIIAPVCLLHCLSVLLPSCLHGVPLEIDDLCTYPTYPSVESLSKASYTKPRE